MHCLHQKLISFKQFLCVCERERRNGGVIISEENILLNMSHEIECNSKVMTSTTSWRVFLISRDDFAEIVRNVYTCTFGWDERSRLELHRKIKPTHRIWKEKSVLKTRIIDSHQFIEKGAENISTQPRRPDMNKF